MIISSESACKIETWQQLNPELTISDNIMEPAGSFENMAAFDEAALSERFWQEGYFLLHDVLPEKELLLLRRAIENIVEHGLPAAMIYLYDEAWRVFMRLRPLLRHFLGDRIALLPHFWAWHVDPGKDGRGWPPHRDYEGESVIGDDLIISLSLWVPLGDATPENGCMYVLPRNFELEYEKPVTEPSEVRLQDARALPAKTGAVMGWRQDVYHWGSRSSAFAAKARVSLSLEFQNVAFDPLADFLLDLETPPGFGDRLSLIVGQFAKYRHMQDIPEDILQWGSGILSIIDGNVSKAIS